MSEYNWEKVKKQMDDSEKPNLLEPYADYDPDSSPYVWETVYRKIYTDWDFWKIFDCNGNKFGNLKCKRNRLCAVISQEKDNYEEIFKEALKEKKEGEIAKTVEQWKNWKAIGVFKMAGDTDFHFKDHGNGYPGYSVYEACICSAYEKGSIKEYEKNQMMKKLKWCRQRHHSLENFSLMPRTGSLNNFKGGKGKCKDRMDIFVLKLNDYYAAKDEQKKDHEIIKNAREKNREVLMDYLALFENVEDYCAKIYGMDKEWTIALIELGKRIENQKPKFTVEDIDEYMNLAISYWNQKHKRIYHADNQ